MRAEAQTKDAPRVVIMDKDQFFREFQRALLAAQGFEVITPTEPHEFTIDHIVGLAPSLIITEILLPGMNGLDLVRDIKKTHALNGCSVVVFSVLQAEARALSAGADEFVQKPLMRHEYLSAVTDRLRRENEEPNP